MTRLGLVAAALAAPVAAQQPRVVVLHLGGDSAQVAIAPLRARTAYLVEVTPAAAQVQLRLRARDPEPPLARTTAPTPAPPGGTAFIVEPRRAGEYFVELTNPGVGATVVRISGGPDEPPGAAAAPAPEDRDETVFNETFPGPYATVVLAAATAYRIEVRPAAGIALRHLRRQGAPPLVLTPYGDEAQGAGGVTYLVIPNETSEYRLDVPTAGTLVNVRIIRDPRETARWSRVAELSRDRPSAGLAVRAAWIGSFPVPRASAFDTVDASAAGLGADACFGAVPRGTWLEGSVGGCALRLSYFNRGSHGDVLTIGLAPRFVLSRPSAPVQLSVEISVSLGTTLRLSTEQTYWLYGAAALVEAPISGRLVLEAETGLVLVNANAGTGTSLSRNAVAPRLAAGLQFRP